ncbi:hypothetical protein BDM02DRAFT_3264650 [Thelephora ganbajun]|uniref:Uncharacterized protein n=1 Tax=Thelephora ganbajun TaxID=370292 RepID=A0ACB6YWN7_THEGA|nr:hypothetical protein BDM02DRAFT_3264650 [Thelephora ganbajun]
MEKDELPKLEGDADDMQDVAEDGQSDSVGARLQVESNRTVAASVNERDVTMDERNPDSDDYFEAFGDISGPFPETLTDDAEAEWERRRLFLNTVIYVPTEPKPPTPLVAWGGQKTCAYIDFWLGVYCLLARATTNLGGDEAIAKHNQTTTVEVAYVTNKANCRQAKRITKKGTTFASKSTSSRKLN